VKVLRLAAPLCVALAVLVAGCAVVPPRDPVDNPRQVWQQRMQTMRAFDQWELRGRLAVKTSKRGETINMYWRRRQGDHHINLYGPMGTGRVIMELSPDDAVLRNNKGETYTDTSPERLLYRVAGWRVPFRSMQYWVLGAAAPGDGYEFEVDRWGRVRELEQNGWHISFEQYFFENGRDLPRRLVMNALPGTEHIVDDAEGEGETIQVKAVIRDWDWSGN